MASCLTQSFRQMEAMRSIYMENLVEKAVGKK